MMRLCMLTTPPSGSTMKTSNTNSLFLDSRELTLQVGSTVINNQKSILQCFSASLRYWWTLVFVIVGFTILIIDHSKIRKRGNIMSELTYS